MRVIWAQPLHPDKSEIVLTFQNDTRFPSEGVLAFRVSYREGRAVKIEKLPPTSFGVDPRQVSFKPTVQMWAEWTSRGLPATSDHRGRFTLIAQTKVVQRPGRIEPRIRKRRPKPYPWLKEPRPQARRRVQCHGHVQPF